MNVANEKASNKDCVGAIADYNKILEIQPGFSIALVMKGLCYAQINQIDSTCICFINGIEKGSKNSIQYYPKYCSKYEPKVEIENFKTGKFKYLTNDSDTSAYFIRDDKFQIEYFDNSKFQAKFKIKWKNNFQYELSFVETNDPNLSFLKKGDKLDVKILKSDTDTYLYYSDLNGMISTGKHKKVAN